jgi:hypothetical protein
MCHFSTPIRFIHKSRLHQFLRVYRDCLQIALQSVRNLEERNTVVLLHRKQNINPPMIGNPFEMAL